MKQILQNLMDGKMELAEVPRPSVGPGEVLIANRMSLISAGTERMLTDFARAGLLQKAKQQPERVKATLTKMKTDGLFATVNAVRNKLGQPIALGYSAVGEVIALGEGVDEFAIGDRVVSNGNHAEIVCVPRNLCAKVPESVSDDEAAFTVVGAIALQGVRLAQPTLGERIVVSGLGLIGLMIVQILKANGCQVLGLDFDEKRLKLAKSLGAEVFNLSGGADPVIAAQHFSGGQMIDAVLIAATTPSSEPVRQAAQMCRKRGRIVLVGVTGLELVRSDFFEKELTFQVSCSYGPGRYDPIYEQKGHDYPLGFVRWTEQRNFVAVLNLLVEQKIDIKPLISAQFEIAQYKSAYEELNKKDSLGILLRYKPSDQINSKDSQRISLMSPGHAQSRRSLSGNVGVGFIGAGNYAAGILIPAFKSAGARLVTVISKNGVSGLQAARKFGFEQTSTDIDNMLADSAVNTVVIATRHDSHSELTARALAAGKHVFVEKPLAISLEQISKVQSALKNSTDQSPNAILMVGFNRRFAPQIKTMKSLLSKQAGPKSIIITANAGAISDGHWAQDRSIGGGRIIGEACHFIDLLLFLAGSPITTFTVVPMASQNEDSATISMRFVDGSIGTIHYFANGSRSFPKERVEVFQNGQVLVLDNFRKMRGFNWAGFEKQNLWRQNKGQHECVQSFVDAVKSGGAYPIPLSEIISIAKTTIEIAEKIRE